MSRKTTKRKKSPQEIRVDRERKEARKHSLESLILKEQKQKFKIKDLERLQKIAWDQAQEQINQESKEHSRLKRLVKYKRESISKKAQA